MPDPADRRVLDPFEARLKAAQEKHAPAPRDVAVSALASGTRYALEIAATTMVGAALGWWIDRWLGTGPWGLLTLLMLGVAAGFWNLLKAVNAESAAYKVRAAENRDGLAGADEIETAEGAAPPAKRD